MAVKFNNIHTDYRLIGVFSSLANFLTEARNEGSAVEGDTYYNTTLNQLRTFDGTDWSPAGMSGVSAGSLNDAASIGTTITVDGSTVAADFAVTVASDGGDVCATLTQNDTTNNGVCLVLVNTGSGVTLDFTSSGTYDCQGTGDVWDITAAGAAHFTAVAVDDDEDIELGSQASGDVRMLFHEGAIGTAGNGLLFDALNSDENLQFGDATYSFDVRFIGDGNTSYCMMWDLDGGTNSLGALIFNDADIVLGDNDELIFGDASGGDWVIDWDNTSLSIIPKANNSPILIGGAGLGVNLSIYGDTDTSILEWNAANDKLVYKSAAAALDVAVMLDDYCQLTFGTGSSFGTTGSGDVQMVWDGTDFHITCVADDKVFNIGDATNAFDFKWFSGVASDYVLFDASEARMEMIDVDLAFDDNAVLYFGTGRDASLQWDDTNSELDIGGNINITGTLTVSGAFDIGHFAFADDEELRFGNSNDFVFHYDAATTNFHIDAATSNDGIDFGSTVDTDVILHGGTATYDVHWDADQDTLCFLDNAVLAFGNSAASPDVEIMWDTDSLNITGTGLDIEIGADNEGMKVTLFGETSGADMVWEESLDILVMNTGSAINLEDDCKILLGEGTTNAGDFSIYSDGANIFIREIAAQGKGIEIGVDNLGLDVKFFGDSSGCDMEWDQSEDALTFEDTAYIKLGTGNDLIMSATTATTTFKLAAGSDLKILDTDDSASKVTFGLTTGSEGLDIQINSVTAGEDIIFDAAGKTLIFDNIDLYLGDSDTLELGDGQDVTLSFDGTNLELFCTTTNVPFAIGGSTNGFDITYSFATAGTIFIDHDGDDIVLSDEVTLKLGTGQDISLGFDGTNLELFCTTVDVPFAIGDTTNGFDLTYYFEGAGLTIATDFDADCLTFSDNVELRFGGGSGGDIMMNWDETKFVIEGPAAADKVISIGETSNLDIVIYGDSTNQDVEFDTSAETVTFTDFNITMTGTTSAEITCALQSDKGGLIIPQHASSSPTTSENPALGAMFYEIDASKLWIHDATNDWAYVAFTSLT